jgi:hypothetical protein
LSTIPIIYPLTMPSSPTPKSAVPAYIDYLVGFDMSKFSGAGQSQDWGGRIWRMQLTLPPMKDRAVIDPWLAFLRKLRGRSGYFLAIGDWARLAPRGTATAAMVNGASQTGNGLIVDGMGAGKTLLEGDLFQLENRLYSLAADATSDGSGNATLQIEPSLRTAPADNAVLTLTNPKGLWRLDQNSVPANVDEALFHGISFSAFEKL